MISFRLLIVRLLLTRLHENGPLVLPLLRLPPVLVANLNPRPKRFRGSSFLPNVSLGHLLLSTLVLLLLLHPLPVVTFSLVPWLVLSSTKCSIITKKGRS